MTDSVTSRPPRRDAHSNRTRILEVARRELGRDPATTLEQIARAAGVVRRTVFGHFPGRQALLEAVVEDSARSLKYVADQRRHFTEAPERALARLVLSLWDMGDRYQLLLALERRDPDAARSSEALAPVRETARAILERGQFAGAFHTLAPPAVLGAGLEALMVSLLEGVNAGSWSDDGTLTAVALLVAAGVSEKSAHVAVMPPKAERRRASPCAARRQSSTEDAAQR